MSLDAAGGGFSPPVPFKPDAAQVERVAYEGILLNAAATGLAALCYLFVGVRVARAKTRAGHSRSAAAFFLVVGTFLLLAASRQVAAYLSLSTGLSTDVDRALFLVLLVPAALAIVPLAHLAATLFWGRPALAAWVALVFAVVATVGVAFAYLEGVTGPVVSPWGTEWLIASIVTKVLLIVALTIPGVVAGVALFVIGRRTGQAAGRRARLVGASCAVYYVVFTIDALGLDGLGLLAARLATAGTAIAAYIAYFPRADARSGALAAGDPERA